jgi:lysozyme family protein
VTIADLIAGILDRERGAFTQHASDHGGATKFGVTRAALEAFRGSPVTIAAVQALTREEAYEVMEHLYVIRSGFLHVADERVRVLLCDWAVNSGVETAIRWAQRTVGVGVDGVCGPITIGALNSWDGTRLLKALGHARQTHYARICANDPTQVCFLEGWLSRNWTVAVEPL